MLTLLPQKWFAPMLRYGCGIYGSTLYLCRRLTQRLPPLVQHNRDSLHGSELMNLRRNICIRRNPCTCPCHPC